MEGQLGSLLWWGRSASLVWRLARQSLKLASSAHDSLGVLAHRSVFPRSGDLSSFCHPVPATTFLPERGGHHAFHSRHLELFQLFKVVQNEWVDEGPEEGELWINLGLSYSRPVSFLHVAQHLNFPFLNISIYNIKYLNISIYNILSMYA